MPIEQTFAALGAASRDEAVIQDVKDAGRATIDALDSTFSELGDRFRSAVKPAEGPVASDTDGSATAASAPDQPAGAEPPGTPDPGAAEPAPEDEPPAGPGATDVAEREGFEPSRGLETPYSLSRRAPSTTRPPLRRRERDLNPRGGLHHLHAFQACALGQTMRSLRVPAL